MSNEYGVYAREFKSIETKMYSYINSEGLFSKLMSDGVTTIIESGAIDSEDAESENFREFFADHVGKVNKMTKALGAKEKVDEIEFISYLSYQMMTTLVSDAKKRDKNSNSPELLRGFFK